MSKTWKILLAVLFALVIAQGAGLLYLWRSGSKSAAAPVAPPAAAAAAKPAVQAPSVLPPPAAQARPQPTRPPPAAQPQPSSALPPAAAPWPDLTQSLPDGAAAPRRDARRVERIRRLQEKMRALSAGGRQPAPLEVDPLLQELAEIQGSTQVGGVDIQVLRDNLRVADRIQKLALELEAESKKPRPERDMAKIKSLQEAILQEQGALRLDFMTGGAARRPAGE
jgi:hypothetical protein